MTNDEIVNLICKLEKINLQKYYPIDEAGNLTDEKFDKRFVLDRIYHYEFNNYKIRLRFVQYPLHDFITLFTTKLRVSNIIKHHFNRGNKVYDIHKEIKIPINLINRSSKIKKIKQNLVS